MHILSARCKIYRKVINMIEHHRALNRDKRLLQESAQCTSNVLQIEEESVMSEHRDVFAELNVLDGLVTTRTEGLSDLALLPGWEKNIAGDTHDEDLVVLQRREAGDEVAWGLI